MVGVPPMPLSVWANRLILRFLPAGTVTDSFKLSISVAPDPVRSGSTPMASTASCSVSKNVPKTETGPMLKSGNSGPSNSPACFPATCPAGSSARTAAGATAMQASKPERATAAAPRTIFENFMPSPSDYASKLSCSRRSNRTSRRVRKSHGSKISSSVSGVTVHSGSASKRERRSRPSTAA